MKTKKDSSCNYCLFFCVVPKVSSNFSVNWIISRGRSTCQKVDAMKGKFGVIFRQKNLKSGGLLRPPLGAECQNGVKMSLRLRATRVWLLLSKNEKSFLESKKWGLESKKIDLYLQKIDVHFWGFRGEFFVTRKRGLKSP